MSDKKELVVVEDINVSQDELAKIDYQLQSGEFEISVSSPLFTELWINVEKQLRKCVKKIELDEFDAGSIAIKIDVLGEVQQNPDVYDTEEGTAVMRPYRAPHIKAVSSLTLKKVEKEKMDKSFNSHEIISKGHKVIAVPVSTAQMKLSDMEDKTSEE